MNPATLTNRHPTRIRQRPGSRHSSLNWQHGAEHQAEQQALRSTLGQVILERAEVVQLMERLVSQFAVVSENQTKAADAIVSIGKALQSMDDRIKLVMTLVDEHHKLFISHGWARPLPKADPLAN